MGKMKKITCELILCCLLGSISTTCSAGILRTVVLTGDHAPGTPDGVVFNVLTNPWLSPLGLVLNSNGQTAFHAITTGVNDDSRRIGGIWSEGSGSLNLVARENDFAPGTPNGSFFHLLSQSNNPLLLNPP